MKQLYKVFQAITLLIAVSLSTACSSGETQEDEPVADPGTEQPGPDEPSEPDKPSIDGFYADMGNFANASDFNIFNTAIDNRQLLSVSTVDGVTTEYYATKEMFIDEDGRFNDFEPYMAFLYNKIKTSATAIELSGDNTYKIHTGVLYYDDRDYENTILYRFNAGRIFGKMAYLISDTKEYTYGIGGDKLVCSTGDVYTISDGLLKNEATGTILVRYTP